jgi:hypothetical protein
MIARSRAFTTLKPGVSQRVCEGTADRMSGFVEARRCTSIFVYALCFFGNIRVSDIGWQMGRGWVGVGFGVPRQCFSNNLVNVENMWVQSRLVEGRAVAPTV